MILNLKQITHNTRTIQRIKATTNPLSPSALPPPNRQTVKSSKHPHHHHNPPHKIPIKKAFIHSLILPYPICKPAQTPTTTPLPPSPFPPLPFPTTPHPPPPLTPYFFPPFLTFRSKARLSARDIPTPSFNLSIISSASFPSGPAPVLDRKSRTACLASAGVRLEPYQ